ncbi:MAG: hypothetical protein OGM67_13675 [Oscillospiraceae bacterium]|nr:MAG: hypothetical protein OGM67_13675 [Oscillospiraceae bacterium]
MKQKSLGVKARKRIGSVVYHCFMVLLSLTMIYPDNGEILWRIDAAGYPERVFWATPEATDSLVIATGIDGKVYAVEYTH